MIEIMRQSIYPKFAIELLGEFRRLEFERRREVTIQDVSVRIVSKEDLIISKLYWARDSHSEFQLRDVKNLLVSGYDDEYLEQSTRRLGLHDLLQECLI